MSDNVVDFERKKEVHVLRRKEAKVEALREAFRQARGESIAAKSKSRKRRKNRKK
ncbi:MAG: hypothetical protein MI746_06400 [Pseudomonadales bacterium]|nr:hypothetical protein [Pseudomonadales bacterium]